MNNTDANECGCAMQRRSLPLCCVCAVCAEREEERASSLFSFNSSIPASVLSEEESSVSSAVSVVSAEASVLIFFSYLSSFLLLLAKELFLCMAAVMVRVGEGCRISLSVLLKIVTEE